MRLSVRPGGATNAAFATLAVALAACDERDACAPVKSACAPLYTPSFDQIYARTLSPSCALGGSACHGPTGRRGGVALGTIDEAYASLVQGQHAGDASCSGLYARITAESGSFRMPPGRALSEGEICSIATWIANGAPR